MWNSRRYDADTNLYYYKFRHYKADIGRWLGRDPIEESGGINLYGFVYNDSINNRDVLGLDCCDEAKEIAIDMAKKAAKKSTNSGYGTRHDNRTYLKIPEHCGNVCCDKKTHKITNTGLNPGRWLGRSGTGSPACTSKTCPNGTTQMFGYHNHPSSGYNAVSDPDMRKADIAKDPEIITMVDSTC